MLHNLVVTEKYPLVFGGMEIAYVKTYKKYKRVLDLLQRNIIRMANNVGTEMANVHAKTTENIVKNSPISSEAKKALLSYLIYADIDAETKKIVSMSNVGGLFEKGVKPHTVHPFMYQAGNGSPVQEWMDARGFKAPSFHVGGPRSTLRRPGVQFMEKGYEKSWKDAAVIIDKHIKKI